MTPFDIAQYTADFFKLDKSLIKAADSNTFKQPAARPLKTGFIITKAKRELGINLIVLQKDYGCWNHSSTGNCAINEVSIYK